MTEPKSRNLTWQEGMISPADRVRALGQRGAVVWLTGLSGSGKSTIAGHLESMLIGQGRIAYVLDGDNVRHGLNGDLGFSPQDRTENIRRIGEVAALFADAGIIVVAAFISPYREDRDRARASAPEGRFFEVHLDVPLEVCEERDPKGLYRKARAGEIHDFTGIDAPYEEPLSPELSLRADATSPTACAAVIVAHLREWGIISENPNQPLEPGPGS